MKPPRENPPPPVRLPPEGRVSVTDPRSNSFAKLFEHPALQKMPAIACLEGYGNGLVNEYTRSCLLELVKLCTKLADRITELEREKDTHQ